MFNTKPSHNSYIYEENKNQYFKPSGALCSANTEQHTKAQFSLEYMYIFQKEQAQIKHVISPQGPLEPIF